MRNHSDSTNVGDLLPGSLVDMLLADQRLRWSQGQRVTVEAYLEHYPQLRGDPAALRTLLAGEIALRREQGDGFELDEFCRRFPDLSPWLKEQFASSHGSTSRDSTSPDGDKGEDRPWPAVPGFQILAEIGLGGMGIVYRAHQSRLNRIVALKMLLGGPAASQRAIARFRAEAAAIAHLQHPNIVQIFDIIEHEGQLLLSLEYVPGGNLAKRIAGKPQPSKQAAEVVRQLAVAMKFAHERGIVHRDLKPSNILLTDDGVPKITDFGLAKRLDTDTSTTKTGTVLGTPDYMAPEQAEGRVREIGPATDIYALGAILYEMLTGQAPFRDEAVVRVLDAVRFKKPRLPRELVPETPTDLEQICLKCLEKSPSQRYASAGDLADDLARFLNGEPVGARAGIWRKLTRWWKK